MTDPISDATRVTELPRLPTRPADSHKGTYGRVLVVAGSRDMSGAAILAGLGALRGGAGLVQLAVPERIQPVVAAFNPCYLTYGLPCDAYGHLAHDAAEALWEVAPQADVLALGPGLGLDEAIVHLVKEVLRTWERPLVLDADGLNALAQIGPAALRTGPAPDTPLVRVLTPHPGEFARLCGLTTRQIQEQREAHAVAFARSYGVTLVLKGHGTIVSDGTRVFCNPTGNPGMATGGTGDVLTGLIAALLAQGIEAFAAAQLGVYLHGLAGDLAARQLSMPALTALDVADFLGPAMRHLSEHEPGPASTQGHLA
ncbi:MAG: NAD(P)H-hydrate dehydratase [Gemmataceae bacterium]